MSGYLFAIVLSVLLVGLIFVLLRTRKVREKYVGIWLVLALAIVAVAVFPGLAFWLADLVGVVTPVNLLFAVGFAVLLAVCIQLSTEVSALEEETRTIAEELALLRLDVERASGYLAASAEPSPGAEPPGPVEP
ncbi:DUF2304 domain-containing protein [Cellulomonas sp.]|uniref:DUF2304 domain-containing protein n=1 Tax=Cellulomonas sp. TaxID=40001 RepID=UPI003BAD477F